jgi:hypothetical protein
VMSEARLGQHRLDGTYPRVKHSERAARRSRWGVRMVGCPMKPWSVQAWSSETMSKILGRFGAGEATASESIDRNPLKRRNVETVARRFLRIEPNQLLRG